MYGDLKPTDRAAIFTTSGQGTVDFTDDLGQLRDGLHASCAPLARSGFQECPTSVVQADLMVNRNDPQAIAAATAEVMLCLNDGCTWTRDDCDDGGAARTGRWATRDPGHAGDSQGHCAAHAAMLGSAFWCWVSGFYNPFDRSRCERFDRARPARQRHHQRPQRQRALYNNVDASRRVLNAEADG